MQEADEEIVQLRRHMDRGGQGHAMVKSEAVAGSERASQVLNTSRRKYFWPDVVFQDLSFYVTEMPAEQLKRKVP